MATSPVLINSLVGLFGNVHGGSFTEAQVQTVLLTDAVTNACPWAVAFHTALALKQGIDPADVEAIREGRLPKDSKLAALSALARTMIEKRGRLDDRDVDRFLAAGFGKDHAPGGRRHRRGVDDHELCRQHHEDPVGGALSGARLAGQRGTPDVRVRPRLHRYCARMTGSVIDGEDVVQETMLKAMEAAPARADRQSRGLAVSHRPPCGFGLPAPTGARGRPGIRTRIWT